MATVALNLLRQDDGAMVARGARDGRTWEHRAPADALNEVERSLEQWVENFEGDTFSLYNLAALRAVGDQLRATCLPFFEECCGEGEGQVVLRSDVPAWLNWPWELLPHGPEFLATGHQWTVRRTTRDALRDDAIGRGAMPLRVLFMACAPVDQVGLDFEREEEAVLRLTARQSSKVLLHIAESGTFDELRETIADLKPHVVHLSGHGIVRDGQGYFTFENERGYADLRDAHDIGQQLFAGNSVRLAFFNACQSSQAAAAGLCQHLTDGGYVPLALGWAASIGDDRATRFARELYRMLAAGQGVDTAVATARRDLFAQGRMHQDGIDWYDPSFALPQLYAAHVLDELVDTTREDRPPRPGIRYELLGDGISGLREGFVGRRRQLQQTRPALRDGEKTVLLLTGIGGAGKSTLATRLANRFIDDGYQKVAVRAREGAPLPFCLTLLQEAAVACQRLGRAADEAMLRDGERPLRERLRLLVEVMNECRLLLVLDNLETLLAAPPAPPQWTDPDFAGLIDDLTNRLTGEGRALLTCRYVPEGYDTALPNVAHLPMPDFTEPDFFKYLTRHEAVVARMEAGELSRELLQLLHRKLGATPRFLEQACAVLATIDPTALKAQLDGIEEGELTEARQAYLEKLFLPQLLDALPPPAREGLSRLALVELPLPLDGVAQVAGVEEATATSHIAHWLRLGLVQRFDEMGQVPLFATYTLQRDFLTTPERLTDDAAQAAHGASAEFFQTALEQNREDELGLSFGDELAACYNHATLAGDRERRRWAAVCIAGILHQQAQFRKAKALMELLLETDHHPEILQAIGMACESLGEWQAARQFYQEAIATHKQEDNFAASLIANLAGINTREGNHAAARKGYEKSLTIMQTLGDRVGEATVWHQLAFIDMHEGNYAAARDGYHKSLEIKHAIGDRAGEAATWHNLAIIDLNEGNYAAARDGFCKVLEMLPALGDRLGEATTWHNLASIDRYEGNYTAAREGFCKSLAIQQAVGDRLGEATTWHNLASIDLDEGNYAAARENCRVALQMRQAIGDRTGEATTLYQIGGVAWQKGLRKVAIQLIAVGFLLLQVINAADQVHAVR